jgi:hypothetical protein
MENITSIPEESWMDKEIAENTNNTPTGDRLPTLKLEENKISEFTVDFSKPFPKWVGPDKKGGTVTKAIIPVIDLKDKSTKKSFWLSVKNPLYTLLLKKAKEGKTSFKVIQVGNQANTKYNLVDD